MAYADDRFSQSFQEIGSLPPHFDPVHAAQWSYAPIPHKLLSTAGSWKKEHAITPAHAALQDIHLLIIDAQKDFCFPEGTLYVGGRSGQGAINDNVRLATFIYRNLGIIKNITTTLDTHVAFQIFSPAFWCYKDSTPLLPHTTIHLDDILSGTVQPNRDMVWWLCDGDDSFLEEYVAHYCRELERAGKYALYLWPEHCLLGSPGHALVGIIQEACLFHAYTRTVQSWIALKGDHPLTENYSVLRPEVLFDHDGQPLLTKDNKLLQRLLTADRLIIAGQATSHCVKSSIEDLLTEIIARDPRLANKVYILGDCMSAVAIPDGSGGFLADFTSEAEQALLRFADAGMHIVSSTTPLADWPDFNHVV